jgi:hypothetical protein
MANDSRADQTSVRIHDKHLKFGFIHEAELDASDNVIGTSGNGDGAIWTGCYLAAEMFRYAVKKREGSDTTQAKLFLQDAVERVRDLSSVPESKFLTRTIFPKVAPPFDSEFYNAEKHSQPRTTNYRGVDSWWLKHPTRDQYAGVLFGLAVTHELTDDASLTSICFDTITRLVEGLIKRWWTMDNPAFPFFETFLIRPDHLLGVLQVAKHVNPAKFASKYDNTRALLSGAVGLPMLADFGSMADHYSNINLLYLYFFCLIQFEANASYKSSYLGHFATLRSKTMTHLNAHFNMIDRVLNGPNAARDAETITLLDELWNRAFRDDYVEDQVVVAPVPVAQRPYADFLWQRSPFVTRKVNSGGGTRESPGIDYILPYWMARYYGVIS